VGAALVEQVKTMDFGFEGRPFTSFPQNISVEVGKMDFGFEGIPFVVNYETTAVTTEIELSSEEISVSDTFHVFNTTCSMAEDVHVSDLPYAILLVAEMVEGIEISDVYGLYNAICKWQEDVSFFDSIDVYNLTIELSTEDISITDGYAMIGEYRVSIPDEIDVSEDEVMLKWPKSIEESASISETAYFCLVKIVSDAFFIYDTTRIGWLKTTSESLGITDVSSSNVPALLKEWLVLVDSETTNWRGVESIADGLTLLDILRGGFKKTVDDSFGITDVSIIGLTIQILDLLGFADLAAGIAEFARSIDDSIELTDEAKRAFTKVAEDAFGAIDVSSLVALFYHSIEDSFAAGDVADVYKALGLSISDSLTITETITSRGTLFSAVYDTIALNVIIELAGEVWECYVLNTPKFHPSVYSGFNFNSFCVFENRAFGANDTGIYELTGTTDDGTAIHSGIVLSETEFGSPNKKRFRRGYIGVSGNSPVMVLECEDGKREVYSIDDQGKVVFSSELKSKKWKLSIADFDTLSTVKLVPVILLK